MASTGPGQGTRSPAITLLQVEALKLKPMICAPGGGLVAQSRLTLGPLDCSPPVSSVHGILQARVLQWVAIPFSRNS